MKLNLGVEDIAYTAGSAVTTTLKVARILEDRYHVMETFYELHRKEIEGAIVDAFTQAIKNGLSDPTPAVKLPVDRIRSQFNNYIDSGEWEHTSGQVIAAARDRHMITHRDGSREMSRSSDRAFVRTGQYRDSFRAWVSDR